MFLLPAEEQLPVAAPLAARRARAAQLLLDGHEPPVLVRLGDDRAELGGGGRVAGEDVQQELDGVVGGGDLLVRPRPGDQVFMKQGFVDGEELFQLLSSCSGLFLL